MGTVPFKWTGLIHTRTNGSLVGREYRCHRLLNMISYKFLPVTNRDCNKALINSLCSRHQDSTARDKDLSRADRGKMNRPAELKLHQIVQKVFTALTVCLKMSLRNS